MLAALSHWAIVLPHPGIFGDQKTSSHGQVVLIPIFRSQADEAPIGPDSNARRRASRPPTVSSHMEACRRVANAEGRFRPDVAGQRGTVSVGSSRKSHQHVARRPRSYPSNIPGFPPFFLLENAPLIARVLLCFPPHHIYQATLRLGRDPLGESNSPGGSQGGLHRSALPFSCVVTRESSYEYGTAFLP